MVNLTIYTKGHDKDTMWKCFNAGDSFFDSCLNLFYFVQENYKIKIRNAGDVLWIRDKDASSIEKALERIESILGEGFDSSLEQAMLLREQDRTSYNNPAFEFDVDNKSAGLLTGRQSRHGSYSSKSVAEWICNSKRDAVNFVTSLNTHVRNLKDISVGFVPTFEELRQFNAYSSNDGGFTEYYVVGKTCSEALRNYIKGYKSLQSYLKWRKEESEKLGIRKEDVKIAELKIKRTARKNKN